LRISAAAKRRWIFDDERRRLRGEQRIVLRRHQEGKELFADQIIQCVLQPEAGADVFRRGTLVDPDLVELDIDELLMLVSFLR
jgi:hypothetical protein